MRNWEKKGCWGACVYQETQESEACRGGPRQAQGGWETVW